MGKGAATLIGLCLLCTTVLAQDTPHEETEYRLKTAGVDPELSKRIHKSIRRGATLASMKRAPASEVARLAGMVGKML